MRLRDAEGATLALVSIRITPGPECGVLPYRNHKSIEVRTDEEERVEILPGQGEDD